MIRCDLLQRVCGIFHNMNIPYADKTELKYIECIVK